MEPLLISLTIAILGVIAITVAQVRQEQQYEKRRKELKGRIVKLSKKITKQTGYDTNYAKIYSVFKTPNRTIEKLQIQLLPTEKMIAKQKAIYDQEFQKQITQYNQEIERWRESVNVAQGYSIDSYYKNQYMQQIYNNRPHQPYYDFRPNNGKVVDILAKNCKLMPENFDYLSETVVKKLEKKGGEVRVKRMPRLFKTALYLSLVVVVWSVAWDIATHVNQIAAFGVHTFFAK